MKLKNPLREGQLINSVSEPLQPTCWKKIGPVPPPNGAGEPNAAASAVQEGEGRGEKGMQGRGIREKREMCSHIVIHMFI